MSIDFTIAFIGHGEFDLMRKTIPLNIRSLTSNTKERFQTLLILDGAEKYSYKDFSDEMFGIGIDEIRVRSRARNVASGDPSNNGHYHLLSDRTPYLISLESDIALFNTSETFDVLLELKMLFQRHEELAVATRMDDHSCWVWKQEEVGSEFEDGIKSVNRVSSHFLAYDVERARKVLGRVPIDTFHDTKNDWFNYEDLISERFARPQGTGIAYLDSFPIRCFHCDEKEYSGSPFYTKDSKRKMQIFDDLQCKYLEVSQR